MVEVGVVVGVVLVVVAIYLATRKQKENEMRDYKFIHYSLFSGLDVETTVEGDAIILSTITTHSIEGGENRISTKYEAETIVGSFEPSIDANRINRGVVVTTKVMAVIREFLDNGMMVSEMGSWVNK